MRKLFAWALLLVVLGSAPVFGRPNDPADGGGVFDRIIRIVKTLWTLRSTSDLPIPPFP